MRDPCSGPFQGCEAGRTRPTRTDFAGNRPRVIVFSTRPVVPMVSEVTRYIVRIAT